MGVFHQSFISEKDKDVLTGQSEIVQALLSLYTSLCKRFQIRHPTQLLPL